MIKLTKEQRRKICEDWQDSNGLHGDLIDAIEAEVLRLNGGGGEAVNRYLDVTLTKDEAEYIAAFIADENDADDDVVQLLVGAGHSGFGLYAWHPEYQEEGSVLVKVLPEPEPMKAADAFELHRLLAEERETVRQLNRALREATESPTFMGEPVRAVKPETQGERWVIVRESVLDVGLGDDVRTGGRPELGYALIPEIPTFGSESEASATITELGLPLGWVRMPLSRLLPDLLSAGPAPVKRVPLTDAQVETIASFLGFNEIGPHFAFARAIEAAHGIGKDQA